MIINLFYSFIIILIYYIIYYSNNIILLILKKKSNNNLINIKNIINNPTYININTIDNIKINIINKDLINIINKNYHAKNIINCYIYNKYIFENLFYNNNKSIIYDLKTFYKFQKNNLNNNNYNILFKFYNNDDFLYIYVKNNNLIKIKKYEEYNKICNIATNNKIFITKDKNNKYYINYIEYKNYLIKKKEIKNIFFKNNFNINNKNYKILNKFQNVKIYYFTTTKIIL